eukprot:543871_1
MYFASYFEALYNIINAAKMMIERLKCLLIPTEIISLIVQYTKYDRFDLTIKQPVKTIPYGDDGVRYEHDWKDMERYKDELKKMGKENVDKLLEYFDKILDNHNDVYNDFDNNNQSDKCVSRKWRKYMSLIFKDKTNNSYRHLQSIME